tara:strand:- start:463 stop:1617 length:1155 start_codon:yes stop_codon:yes gene_type:complete
MKIAVFVNSRANYGRIKSFLKEVKKSSKLDLKLVVGASGLLSKYGKVVEIIKEEGFKVDAELHSVIEGDLPISMAKSTGLGIIEAATAIENLNPDAVLTIADRYETLATAVAASYMNIHLIHTQGGDRSGSIDESVRHAITKLSHIHFPASEKSKANLLKMGEDPNYVFNVGCPGMDLLNDLNLNYEDGMFEKYKGVGMKIDFSKPYLVVLMHPVTTEYNCVDLVTNELVNAIIDIKDHCNQVVWLWPNIDSGNEKLSKEIKISREEGELNHVHFYKNFSPEDYLVLINNCQCLVGNSSSGLREAGYMGIPVVNIGNRQKLREHGDNVFNVEANSMEIASGIKNQLKNKRYEPSNLLGNGDSGKKMCQILENLVLPPIQKKLYL